MQAFIRDFFKGKGQGVVEYAVILAFVVIALIGLMLNTSGNVKTEVSTSFAKTASIFQN